MTEPNITIRLAKIEDATYISLLGRITFTETFAHLFRDRNDLIAYYENTFSVEKIRHSLGKENNIFWIAFAGELPVGYAKLKRYSTSNFLEEKKQSQLQKIYVLNDFHSKKIGYLLQEKLVSKAKEISNIIWLSALTINEKSINFYKKLGFYHIGNTNFTIGKEKFYLTSLAKKLN